MPDQRTPETPERDRCEIERQIDKEILALMFLDASWLWSVDEITRELGDRLEVADAIRRLTDHGLIHRLGDFVFPTRTARRAADIEIGM
jgi:hypothetical protein